MGRGQLHLTDPRKAHKVKVRCCEERVIQRPSLMRALDVLVGHIAHLLSQCVNGLEMKGTNITGRNLRGCEEEEGAY